MDETALLAVLKKMNAVTDTLEKRLEIAIDRIDILKERLNQIDPPIN